MLRVSTLAVGVALAATANATCPINECNYLDPQYQTAFKQWSDCANAYVSAEDRAMGSIAILYPRFGIAYQAFMDEIKTATANGSGQAALDAAKQRFDDRILRTAEPEAVQDYQMLQVVMRQHPIDQKCGAMPTPPRGQP